MPGPGDTRDLPVLRVGLAVCALLNVAALLAWVFGLGPFRVWFVATGAPALVVLAVVAMWTGRHPDRLPRLRLAIVAGSVGGLLGTIGYDLFRVPFVLGGLRLFAPIDSYGVLLLDAGQSSSATALAGWSFHFANGICFGIAYALVALGRRWQWGVVWGLVLETATVLTPFADSYNLRGNWDLIAIAYAAHLAYGAPLGVVVQRAAAWDVRRPLPLPSWTPIAGLVVGLLLVLRPVGPVSDTPATDIVRARFVHEWLRIAPGECAVLTNRDDVAYELPEGEVLAAGSAGEVCPSGDGAHRVRLTSDPFSGGFVLVDPEA